MTHQGLEYFPGLQNIFPLNFSDQYIHILNNKNMLNRLKMCHKNAKDIFIFKISIIFYNVQKNNNVNYRDMKTSMEQQTVSIIKCY